MFKINDRALRIARILILVAIGIFAVSSFISGVLMAVLIDGLLFLFTFCGWFGCLLMWLVARLFLSYLVDVKLIRNKLYGESNEGLDVFLKTKGEISHSSVMQEKKQKFNTIKFNKKRLISGVIIGLIGLMTLLTLCIPIARVNSLDLSESGFSLMNFFSEKLELEDWIVITTGVFSILTLFLSVATITFSVLSIFCFKEKTANKLLTGFSISCLIIVFIYMILGIIWVSMNKYLIVMKNTYNGIYYYKYANSVPFNALSYKCSTLSYIGFILVAVLFVAYILCNYFIKKWNKMGEISFESANYNTVEKESVNINTSTSIPTVTPTNVTTDNTNTVESNRAIGESLKMYKELLDSGIITQEEFDRKKTEILR